MSDERQPFLNRPPDGLAGDPSINDNSEFGKLIAGIVGPRDVVLIALGAIYEELRTLNGLSAVKEKPKADEAKPKDGERKPEDPTPTSRNIGGPSATPPAGVGGRRDEPPAPQNREGRR